MTSPAPTQPFGVLPEPSLVLPAAPHPEPQQQERPRRKRLGEILVDSGVVDEQMVMRALAVQEMGGGRLGSVLTKLNFCTEEQIRAALKQQMDVEVVDLGELDIDPRVMDLVPLGLIRKYEVVPLRMDNGVLWVAMMDPYNLAALDDLRFATGCKKTVVVTCTEGDFRRLLEEELETQTIMDEILDGAEFFERCMEVVDDVPGGNGEAGEELVHDLELASEQHPVVTLCNFLLVESIRRRASDIHIEAYENYFRVRIRIDGQLQNLLTPPKRLHSPMIARCKVMSGMDIAKRRIPQDGHIAIQYEGETVHFRVSTLPTVYGEKCVIRLLKKDTSLLSLDSIGFEPEELANVKKSISMPQGLVLVTGPTGSGKTTTLHAAIQAINEPEVNIVTLEDPVEATLPDINHVKIDENGGVTFASGLRSILRQDPDVVFVGEMRDSDVSRIALKAALTGHMVFSTLHTNSASESITRLEDMDVPRYLLAAALEMIIAQRLLRRLCSKCRVPAELTADEISEFELSEEDVQNATLTAPKGCNHCNNGWRGRQAAYEIFRVNGELRELIRTGAKTSDLEECAQRHGMKKLFRAGVLKALQGITTLGEVRRVLGASDA